MARIPGGCERDACTCCGQGGRSGSERVRRCLALVATHRAAGGRSIGYVYCAENPIRVFILKACNSGPDRRGTATICAGLRSALCGPHGEKHDDEDEMPVDHSDTPVLRDKSSPQALISSMGSSDCVNLTSAMKALIAGFTNNHAIGDEGLGQFSCCPCFRPYILILLLTHILKRRREGKGPSVLPWFRMISTCWMRGFLSTNRCLVSNTYTYYTFNAD